ncbi:MAG TPA: baseplate J/gp47 family protein [Candidatus Binataceae bacterium]|nr:baseplate J/gp47 family protein [Candidatus Binataceae bacterium]
MANVNPTWQPNATIPPATVIIDANGNVELSVLGGITGPNPPLPWPQNIGDTTQDNTTVWELVAVFPQPAALPLPNVLSGDPPSFITDADGTDVNAIINDMIDDYQTTTGRILYPAQPERLYLNRAAYRELLVRLAIQYTGEQNLLAFASYPALDFIGQMLGVTRLPAQPASTTLQFTLNNALTVPLTIPAGTQVGTADGQFVFATTSALTIPTGATTGTVNANCTVAGAAANGYLSGSINVLLNPNALIASVTNTAQANGGSSPETDDHFRTRIQAAPNQFSDCGPADAYRFFALGVNPSIVDASVVSPSPGTVNVYVLLGPVTQPAASPNGAGIAGSGLLNEVLAVLSADTVRPLTDTVNVLAVTEVDYVITATVTLYSDADPTTVEAAVNQAASVFAQNLAARIQRDIVPSQIIEALSVNGVYEVSLSSPAYTQLTAGQWANCTAINLTFVVGSEHS